MGDYPRAPRNAGKLLACFVLLSVVLAGCDPCASKSICIRLKPEKGSGEIVLRVLGDVLLDAGFRRSSEDAVGAATYIADIAEGDRHTAAHVLVSYQPETREIAVHVVQYFGSQLGPKMKTLLATAQERIVKTGRVEEILFGSKSLYRP
ncbi:hypothetical protein DB345_16065 [Spartobacteria bacterium LR76]|nr:hypothetical protein DB345_16065 [Spartobacteria bacterium LR76]